MKYKAIHHYTDYRWLRGFNIIPSWGARIEQAWWEYDGSKFRREAALATKVHSNCIRLWIEFSAWMADPVGVQNSFMDAVTAIDEHGMKTMPCLFNRWHDRDYDYGGTYNEDLYRNLEPKLDYVRALVKPLVADERILIWDLCNEPSACRLDYSAPDLIVPWELYWLSRVADVVRQTGAQQPITIGTTQSLSMEIYAPLCDVLCCHPYAHAPEQLAQMLGVCRDVCRKFAKPMLSNETIPGSLDDAKRAQCAKWTIPMMEDAGYGWMGWGLREGQAVSTRRDRFDSNGLDGQGFHAWFNHNGSLREGLEFLTETPRHRAPWATDRSITT